MQGNCNYYSRVIVIITAGTCRCTGRARRCEPTAIVRSVIVLPARRCAAAVYRSSRAGGRAGSRRDGPLIRGPRLLGVSVSSHPNPTARPPRTVCARGPWAWCLRTGARVLGGFT